MGRAHRIDYPGARHHVMNRGLSHGNIFDGDADCRLFLSILWRAAEHFGIRVAAFVLMPNHYHLLVESREGNLSSAMKLVGQEFTQKKNGIPGRDGPLFKGRFTSRLVTDPEHWFHLPFYLHLNPVKAHLVLKPGQWEWSSRNNYARKNRINDYPFLDCAEELSYFGGQDGYRALERGIMTGRRQQPEGLDTVLFGSRAKRPAGNVVRPEADRRDPVDALNDVVQITGCTLSSLQQTIRGAGGNLPRALAVWWLAYGYHRQNVEIAAILGMTQTAVAKTLAKFKGQDRRYQNEQLWEWLNILKLKSNGEGLTP